MDYVIEKALPGDIETIARFQVDMALTTEHLVLDRETVFRGVRTVFEKPDIGFYLVARDSEGKPVGSLLIQKEWSDWRNTEAWWIHSVYVLPERRRQGIFRKMFAYAETLARAEGIFVLRLFVKKNNMTAKAAYCETGMSSGRYDLMEKEF
jgi:GNAT superfamily N-acetyltransferase